MSGKTSYESRKKYEDKTYDRIGLLVPKGTKDIWKAAAAEKGKSLNAFIVEAVKNYMKGDQKARGSNPLRRAKKRTAENTVFSSVSAVFLFRFPCAAHAKLRHETTKLDRI